jgi:ABC-type polar amino acid transport system ATPase subunit
MALDLPGAAADETPVHTDDAPVVQVERMSKFFGRNHVLRDVDLSIKQGETVVIIGPSGCGKSTLCRTIMGLEPFTGGRITLEGEWLAECTDGKHVKHGRDYKRRRLAMGMVFQQYTLFPQLTLRKNVELGPSKVLHLPESILKERTEAVLQRVGLGDKIDSFPAHVSGGQKQRAAIARELAMERRLIMFDEVTSALDPELVHEVLQVMKELAEAGTTMLVVTHEMGFARSVANRVVFMADGQIVEQGPSSEILDHPQHNRTRTFLEHILE